MSLPDQVTEEPAGDDEDYLEKSPAAARMGKAAEYLVAASCVLASRGELNVSTAMVDDDGVDLVFHRRGYSATLAVQVKSRMSTAKVIQQQRFMAQVRSQTFRPRADLDMLFVAIDVGRGAIMMAWLVPSTAFVSMAAGPNSRGRMVFTASMKADAKDQWLRYRLTAEQLPGHVLGRLEQLDGGRSAGMAAVTAQAGQ